MKKKWLLWLIMVALAALGLGLYPNIPTSFLGLVCFALAALVGCYLGLGFLRQYKPKLSAVLGRILTGLVILGLLVVGITGIFVGRATGGAAEEACGYIIVLGAKVNGTEPSRILSERIRAAYHYLQAHPDTVAVLSGGKGADEGISEAQCMYNSLTSLGIDPARLILEDRSTSTWENLEFSLARMPEKPRKIGIVTSDFHLFRAQTFAKTYALETVGIPGQTGNKLYFVNYFLREIAGIWHYILLGQ